MKTGVTCVRGVVALLLVVGLSSCGGGGSGGGGKGEGKPKSLALRGDERDPTELLHKSNKETFVMLGTPDFNRREGLTEHWQYRSDSCTLDMYFIAEGRGSQLGSVRHFELRPSSSDARMDKAALRRCYARLVAERSKSARGEFN